MSLSHFAASVPRTETLRETSQSLFSKDPQYDLRHIIRSSPRGSIFNVIISRHVLGSHDNLVAGTLGQKESGCQPGDTGSTVVSCSCHIEETNAYSVPYHNDIFLRHLAILNFSCREKLQRWKTNEPPQVEVWVRIKTNHWTVGNLR